MINLITSESYAIDYYSILEVKCKKISNNININNLNNCYENLINELGKDKVIEILISKEYQELYDVNKRIFELIDHIKENPKTVFFEDGDSLNYKRYLIKQQIQEKYFNNHSNEIKINYDKI